MARFEILDFDRKSKMEKEYTVPKLTELIDVSILQQVQDWAAKTAGIPILIRDAEVVPLHSKGTYTLESGDVVSFIISGGGGYGSPMERDPQSVLKDVTGGYVSMEGAKRDYGVVINPENMNVDLEGTRTLRKFSGGQNE